MACSFDKEVAFSCYIFSGEDLVPVCVAGDVQLKDLNNTIKRVTLQNADENDKYDEEPTLILLVKRKRYEEAEKEDRRSLSSQLFGTQTGTKQSRSGTEPQGIPGRKNEDIKRPCQDVDSGSSVSLPSTETVGVALPVEPRLSLEGLALYSYMWLTFQWIEPRQTNNYNVKLPFVFYKVMRLIVALSLWAIVGFELYNLVGGFPALVADVEIFTAVVAVLHRFLWTVRYVILHHLGLYFFYAHQELINDILANSSGISTAQWRKCHRRVQDCMALTAFFLLVLPLLQKLIPIFIQEADSIPRSWDRKVETVEFIILVYSRFVAMPVFFFLILVAQINIFELQNLNQQIQQSPTSTTELFKEYKSLTQRIQRSSRAFQPYLTGLLFLLVLWGTISVYSSVEMLQKIPSPAKLVFGVVVSESIGTLFVFLCETLFLFSLPLYTLGRVSSLLKHLIFTVTALDCDEQRLRGLAFNTEGKKEQFSSLLEKHQKYGEVGFRVLGLYITELKSVWLTLLGPVIAFVGNFLLKEHF